MSLLKNYIESFSYYETISRTEKIEKGRQKLFDFDYPFYDETKRQEFETHFIKHFYMREIGEEVIGLFKFRLEDYLTLNMPYWNNLFQSELMDFPVFEDFNYTISEDETKTKASQIDTDSVRDKTSQRDSDTLRNETKKQGQALDEAVNNLSDTTDTTNENNFHRNVFSDTPQSDLQLSTNGDGTGVVTHASTLEEDKDIKKSDSVGSQKDVNKKTQQIDTDTTENETTGVDTKVVENDKKSSNTDLKEQHAKENDKIVKGKKGTTDYAEMLMKYRSTFMRIEKELFQEINKEGLFLLVYGGR